MIEHKTTISIGASYAASISGMAIAGWLSENWLGIVSVIFMLLTFLTTRHFQRNRERREIERHDIYLKNHHRQLQEMADKLDQI